MLCNAGLSGKATRPKWFPNQGAPTNQKLDDGWPKSEEEQVTQLLVKNNVSTKCFACKENVADDQPKEDRNDVKILS